MDRKWELDEATTVTAHFGWFGKKVISVNGQKVYDARKYTRKREIEFSMPDGRPALLSLNPEFVGRPTVHLRVAGNLIVETPKKPLQCASCKAVAKPYDKFCASCGKPMPTAQDYELRGNINTATNAIKALAVLFILGGLLMFAITKNQTDAALTRISNLHDEQVYPKQIQGKTYKVGELRKELEWEPWSVLWVNMILATMMIALALWARRSPLPAVLIATATYLVVIVASGIADPRSLGQGWIIKLIVIAFLVKGIKAALALRDARASTSTANAGAVS
ncbi:MAG: zinc ribbon domain-containing protein [Betaproteobacteria bacterium]|nr:zinc ribbon domain-containing protein [Betaproteobacteria bacterium]